MKRIVLTGILAISCCFAQADRAALTGTITDATQAAGSGRACEGRLPQYRTRPARRPPPIPAYSGWVNFPLGSATSKWKLPASSRSRRQRLRWMSARRARWT